MKMNTHLENKAEELEHTLATQIQLLKKDSEEWLKVGAVIVVTGLVAYTIVKSVTKKKTHKKRDLAIEALEAQGLLTKEIEDKLRKPARSTFWPSLGQRLLIAGITLAKDKFLINMMNPQPHNAQAPQRRW